MKKVILILSLTTLITNSLFSQKFEVTPNGLADADNIENRHLVLSFNGLNEKQLYDNAIKYINENYKSPEDVIKGKTEGEYLRFETYVSEFVRYNNSGAKIQIECTYTTELRFKEGKVRYEITSLDMPAKDGGWKIKFQGGIMSGYVIYKKNGKIFKEKTKIEIENYFNSRVRGIHHFLSGGSNASDDW